MKILKSMAAILLAGVLVLSVASCNNKKNTTACMEHVDADKNGVCDICGKECAPTENVCTDHIDTDGDNRCDICDAVISEPVSFTVTVKGEDGKPLSGLKVTLSFEGEETVSGNTDANGQFAGSIVPGSYTVNVGNAPEGWLVEGNGKTVNIDAENGNVEFTVVDNNPDGSEEKPFFVGEEAVAKTISAGAELFFDCRGAGLYLVVTGTNLKLTYKEKEYLSESGEIRVMMEELADTNTLNSFSISNTGSSETSITVALEAQPGSMENPYEGKLNEKLTATVSKDHGVYYKWVADRNGYLLLESENSNNHMMLYNTTSFVVTHYTDGARCVFLAVKEGDTVSIAVSSKSDTAEPIVFMMSLCAGIASDPLPLYESDSIRLAAGESIAFAYRGENATISLPSKDVTVLLNGTAVAAKDGSYTVTAKTGDILTLTSTAAENADVTVSITAA